MRHLDDEDLDILTAMLEVQILTRLEQMESRIMAAIDDLNTSVSNLQTSATAIVDKLNAANQDPGIASAATAVQAVADQLTAATAT